MFLRKHKKDQKQCWWNWDAIFEQKHCYNYIMCYKTALETQHKAGVISTYIEVFTVQETWKNMYHCGRAWCSNNLASQPEPNRMKSQS